MPRLLALLPIAAALAAPASLPAQDPEPAAQDASQQVEESDEAFRRRMELEDARHRDPTYVDPPDDYRRELEKIDRLPEASRENIREQLIGIIMENGEWTPDDARREYPYRPSAAAQGDADLAEREQAAWDEQIEKYHAREAEAFGAYRGPVAGPGNPDGAEGGAGDGQSGDAGTAGAGAQAGQQGESGAADQAGTYQPYDPNRQTSADSVSTAGVSESALDYVLGRGGRQGESTSTAEGSATAAAETAPTVDTASEPAPENAPQDLRGMLLIEDLDKLGDSVRPPPEPPEDAAPPPDDTR